MTTTIDQFVTTTLENLGAVAPIDTAAPLMDLGIDSLDIAEFAQILDEELGVKLESKDLKELRNVGDLIALIKSRQA
ncbi:MAG: phosphopantetheine-binding protein [Solirubrobacteraceae bacterium]|nr:phosphopantetheine-binding protein [Patulibacter sp.]